MKIEGNCIQWCVSSTLLLGTLSTGETASAFPVQASYVDTDRCDQIDNITLTEELGEPVKDFGIDELIESTSKMVDQVTCVPEDGRMNDWEVSIKNLSNRKWQDLFFVSDSANRIGNADGVIQQRPGGFLINSDAFRIDNIGRNKNLLGGDTNKNGIFDPNETWVFLVSNFVTQFINPVGMNNLRPTPFNSKGVGVDSAMFPPSTASIVARPVPEPSSTLSLLALGTLGAGSALKRKQKQQKSAIALTNDAQ